MKGIRILRGYAAVILVGSWLAYQICTLFSHASNTEGVVFFLCLYTGLSIIFYTFIKTCLNYWYKALFAIGMVMCIHRFIFNFNCLFQPESLNELCKNESITFMQVCSTLSMFLFAFLIKPRK